MSGRIANWLKTDQAWARIAGVAAVLAAFFAYYQAQVAKDTGYRQLRAYVGVVPLSNEVEDVGKISIKNFGLTPATEVQVYGFSEARRTPLFGKELEKAISTLRRVEGFSQVVFPSDSIPWMFGPESSSSSRKKSWDEFGGSFYTYGRIDYNDLYGVKHRTEFCVFSNQNEARVNRCVTGNTAR